MSKSRRSYPMLALCLSLIFISVCCSSSAPSEYADNPIADRETLTQVSTINALMAGVYDGVITSGQLKGFGDFGIGTFEGLDGEMVELDGNVYQVKNDGLVYAVADSIKIPFAAVTFFDNDHEVQIEQNTNFENLQKAINEIIPSPNMFYAVKIEGKFNYVKTRSVPKQTKPYPILTEVTKYQSEFEFNDIEGTIVGFICPEYVNGVNVPGYHLHFLSDDFRSGGHVLEFNTDVVLTTLDYTTEFFMILPEMGSDFYKTNVSEDNSKEIKEAER